MKLEELLGEELYNQVKAKIDEANSKEPDKLKHIRYADLSEGEYVSKGKHDSELEKLNGLISGKDSELENAKQLIEELKKSTKNDKDAQKKIGEYEAENTRLLKELENTKINSAIKLALLSEKAADTDYMAYKLRENIKSKNQELSLDEDGNIKGLNDMITELKNQFPNQFEGDNGGKKNVFVNNLPGGKHQQQDEPKDLAEALKQQYEANNE
jgi:hypothetical protein